MGARSLWRRLTWPLVAVAAAGLAAAGPAGGVLTPLPVVDIITDSRVSGVTVAASPRGDAVVGYTGLNNGPTVLAAFRPGDGPFAPVETLSTIANGEGPNFVFEPDGAVLAVWSHATSATPGGYSTRARTGTFGPEVPLPSGERFAHVAIDAAGTALAVWKSFNAAPTANDLVVASRRALGGAFEPPVPLSPAVDDNVIQPRVAVNPTGEAVVGWTRAVGTNSSVLEARIGSVTGPAFGGAQTLASETAADEFVSAPEVAIGPGGEAIAVWTRGQGTSTLIEYAVRAPGTASFGPAATLASGAFGARLGVDASGAVVIAFIQGSDESRVPSALVRPPGGPPGAIATLAPASMGGGIASAGFDASGAALVVWSREIDDDTTLAEAARRPAGGSFGPVAPIADMGAGGGLAAAAEPDGDVIAAWQIQTGMSAFTLKAGGLDFSPDPPAPPVLGPSPAQGPAAVRRVCAGKAATIVGTARTDRLRGTARRDVIAALAGDDLVSGLGGDDVICGGAGHDRLLGGAGKDLLSGGRGPDRLLGGPGRDRLLGGAGRDRLLGGLGLDVLRGGAGRDAQLQ